MLKKEGKQFYKQVDFVLVEIVILCVCVYTHIYTCVYMYVDANFLLLLPCLASGVLLGYI